MAINKKSEAEFFDQLNQLANKRDQKGQEQIDKRNRKLIVKRKEVAAR